MKLLQRFHDRRGVEAVVEALRDADDTSPEQRAACQALLDTPRFRLRHSFAARLIDQLEATPEGTQALREDLKEPDTAPQGGRFRRVIQALWANRAALLQDLLFYLKFFGVPVPNIPLPPAPFVPPAPAPQPLPNPSTPGPLG